MVLYQRSTNALAAHDQATRCISLRAFPAGDPSPPLILQSNRQQLTTHCARSPGLGILWMKRNSSDTVRVLEKLTTRWGNPGSSSTTHSSNWHLLKIYYIPGAEGHAEATERLISQTRAEDKPVIPNKHPAVMSGLKRGVRTWSGERKWLGGDGWVIRKARERAQLIQLVSTLLTQTQGQRKQASNRNTCDAPWKGPWDSSAQSLSLRAGENVILPGQRASRTWRNLKEAPQT